MSELYDLLKAGTKVCDKSNANIFHSNFRIFLEDNNWNVHDEVFIDYNESKKGYIDIVATKEKKAVALELDRKTPRKKSIQKLKRYSLSMNYYELKKFVITRENEKILEII